MRVLDGLRAEKDLPDDKKKVIAGLDARLAREKHYMRLALALFLEALPKSEHPLDARYMCAELQRKLGEKKKAIETLTALLAGKELSKGQRDWAEEALAKLHK